MLKPLSQWYCDTCYTVIEKPEDGFLEWIRDPADQKSHCFRIVHHWRGSSPGSSRGDENWPCCYQHVNALGRSDMHLDQLIGPDVGISWAMSFIDAGPWRSSVHREYAGPQVKDLGEWSELMRRLFLPYYEEARLYFSDARNEGLFDSGCAMRLTPPFLEMLIKRFGNRQNNELLLV